VQTILKHVFISHRQLVGNHDSGLICNFPTKSKKSDEALKVSAILAGEQAIATIESG
jgi:hypothetical protein